MEEEDIGRDGSTRINNWQGPPSSYNYTGLVCRASPPLVIALPCDVRKIRNVSLLFSSSAVQWPITSIA